MSSVQLTSGICERIRDAQDPEEIEALSQSEPTVQILSIKKVGPTGVGQVDRYRIIVSDGITFQQAMMATHLNHFVDQGEVQKNTVVKIEKFTCNTVQDKKLLIVLSLSVVCQCEEKIGEPHSCQPDGKSATTTPAVEKPVSKATPAASTSTAPAPVQPQGQQNRAGHGAAIYPIEALSPYQNNWKIKVLVTQKSEIRTWSNQRGEGKLFNVTLVDDTGEIRATGFNRAVDELYDKIQEGKVYYISKAKVNLAKRKFNPNGGDYELNFSESTEIEECTDAAKMPTIHFNFTPLDKLADLPKDATCDVIGVVTDIGPTSELTTKLNRTATKREITIVDTSGFSVRTTLWGKQAVDFNPPPAAIVAWKSLRVSDFGGRSLGTMSSSIMEINPDVVEAHQLRGWYDASPKQFKAQSAGSFSGGGSSGFNRNEVRFFHDVREAELGMHGDKPDYFSARGTIMHIRPENLAYPACRTEGCSKKVIEQHDGWRCEKCDRSWDRPSYRYIISMAVADHSGQAWLQGFNDVGQVVFGMTADELEEIKDRDNDKFNRVLQNATGSQFNFNCRAKQETFNEQTRVRYGIQKILPLDYKEEANHLRAMLSSDWAK